MLNVNDEIKALNYFEIPVSGGTYLIVKDYIYKIEKIFDKGGYYITNNKSKPLSGIIISDNELKTFFDYTYTRRKKLNKLKNKIMKKNDN